MTEAIKKDTYLDRWALRGYKTATRIARELRPHFPGLKEKDIAARIQALDQSTSGLWYGNDGERRIPLYIEERVVSAFGLKEPPAIAPDAPAHRVSKQKRPTRVAKLSGVHNPLLRTAQDAAEVEDPDHIKRIMKDLRARGLVK